MFRKLVGSFGSGVTVVSSGSDGEFHAMTASAFTSVSLEPPMVLICVDKSAQSAEIIRRHGYFSVSILAEGQEAISNACAKRDTPESNGLVGVEHRLGPLGLPMLEGTIASLECRTVHEYEGGDHLIFVGQVESGSLGEAEQPLMYFRGSYGSFGRQ
jgi:flavin reductase (DIM6/NTAB) family NADH-FMN oxidoreductase RutF